jgi:hypothetical protein
MKKIGEKVRSRPSMPELPSWQRLPGMRLLIQLFYRLRNWLMH